MAQPSLFHPLEIPKTMPYTYIVPSLPKLQEIEAHVRRLGGQITDLPSEMNADFRANWGSFARHLVRVTGLSALKELDLRRAIEERYRPGNGLKHKPLYPEVKIPDGLSIRKAETGDLDDLVELQALGYVDEKYRATADDLKRRIGAGQISVLYDKGRRKAVGSIGSMSRPFERLQDLLGKQAFGYQQSKLLAMHHYLIDVVVLPDTRYRGGGAALVNHALLTAVRHKYTKVYLEAINPESYGFFESLGFVLHSPTFNPDSKHRLYWAPIQGGETERDIKRNHRVMNESFVGLPKSEEPRKDLNRVMDGLLWKYGRDYTPEERIVNLSHEFFDRHGMAFRRSRRFRRCSTPEAVRTKFEAILQPPRH